MDLGIRGKRALVCASSRGLGRGCAEALAEAGVDLVLNARGVETLEATADHIRQRFPIRVTPVPGDITTEAGRAAVLAEGPFDILVTNAGGPPPGMWSDWRREDFIRALDANMLTPIALMQAVLPGMMERGWGRVVNITSVSVKAPVAGLGARDQHGRGHRRAGRNDPGGALRNPGRIRCGLRLPVFAACGLHHRAECAAGRRGHQHHAVAQA